MIDITITWHNAGPHTIWGKLAARLGRKPTNEEAKAEVLRILADNSESLAKATKGKTGMAVRTPHVRQNNRRVGLRVGEAVAVQPATSEFMDVTAGETAPSPARRCDTNIVDGSGECFACNAVCGETCQKPLPTRIQVGEKASGSEE